MAYNQRRSDPCVLVLTALLCGCNSEADASPNWWGAGGATASDAADDSSSDADTAQDAGGEDRADTQMPEDASPEAPLPDVIESGEEVDCDPTNGGVEACDGIDNDCDGEIDESFDLSSDPRHCGVCDNDCSGSVLGATAAKCTADPGTPGVCGYAACSSDYWDLDGDPSNGCEYYCVQKSTTDATCDHVDDDCNGVIDDDVDFCTSVANCGGKPHVIAACTKQDPAVTDCDEYNTICVIDACEPGYVDANGFFGDGCEYQCTPSKRTDPADPATLVPCDASDPECGATEYCDGIDNDCDGPVDEGC